MAEKHREHLINMLLEDRQAARMGKNPSAAVAASTRIADLLLSSDASTKQDKVHAVRIFVVHQNMCPVCKERTPIEDPQGTNNTHSPWDEDEE